MNLTSTDFELVNLFDVITHNMGYKQARTEGGPGGPVDMGLRFWGRPIPPGRGKRGSLVKNIDIVKFERGLHFPSGLGLLPPLHGPGYKVML